MSKLEIITAMGLPRPGGHYSHAVRHGDLLYVSGQLPVKRDGSHAPHASFEAQCEQTLANLFAILEAGHSSASEVIKVTAYLVGVERWPELNRIYARVFGEHRPARSVVPVPELHHGYLIEIDAIAAVKPK